MNSSDWDEKKEVDHEEKKQTPHVEPTPLLNIEFPDVHDLIEIAQAKQDKATEEYLRELANTVTYKAKQGRFTHHAHICEHVCSLSVQCFLVARGYACEIDEKDGMIRVSWKPHVHSN